MNANTETIKPIIMSMNVRGMEIRVVLQVESPWPYSVQKRVGRKTWEQIDAYTDVPTALLQAVYYVNSKPF